MNREHVLLLMVFLGAVGLQVGTLHEWQEAMRPGFVGSAMVQVAVVVRAFYTEKAGRNGGE